MGAALALVYVSLFEGFGVTLLEAMHCEVPILTSNISSLQEVAGKAGLLFNPYYVNAIAEGLQTLYENPVLRQQLIEKGKHQLPNHPHTHLVPPQLYLIYHAIN